MSWRDDLSINVLDRWPVHQCLGVHKNPQDTMKALDMRLKMENHWIHKLRVWARQRLNILTNESWSALVRCPYRNPIGTSPYFTTLFTSNFPVPDDATGVILSFNTTEFQLYRPLWPSWLHQHNSLMFSRQSLGWTQFHPGNSHPLNSTPASP